MIETNKMRTRIIAAFPGIGKSTFHKNNPTTTLDSDSSEWSWVTFENGTKEGNPEFPQNYIKHIKSNIGKYEFIFVSTHAEVRKELLDNCMFFYWISPHDGRKKEFMKRYVERGNDDPFVKLLDANWSDWIKEFHFYSDVGLKKIYSSFVYLSDELNHIIKTENEVKK